MATIILSITAHGANGQRLEVVQLPIDIPADLLPSPAIPGVGDFSSRELADELAKRLRADDELPF